MKKVLHSIFSNSGLFLFILFVGALLRFFDPFDIPFTHDELSALYRLQFDNFSDLIEGGVRLDGHPALVHVFLYYWTALGSTSEFWVKLPFLLLGVASLYLVYKIGNLWFNSTVALIAMAFVATLQFPIMYSQIARPYVSGLFFSLLLVFYWTKFLFHSSHSNRMYAGMVISAALCAYNHYFSFMFAAVVGITGLFVVSREDRKKYVLAFVLVALLFLPHLGIFMDQLSLGGLSWLAKPTPMFILEHLLYIFHFEVGVYLLVLLVLITGIVKSNRLIYSKFQYISMIWFLTPLVVGIGYSMWVKPVIQHSMLLFSFPFLILLIASFLPELSRKWKVLLVFLVILINTGTLIENRRHYQIFYHQPFEQTFKMAQFVKEKHPQTHFILNGNPNYHAFYFKNSGIQFSSIFSELPQASEFKSNLNEVPSDYLFLSNVPASLQDVAKEVFPYPSIKQQGLNREDVLLSKKPEDNNPRIVFPPFYETEYLAGSPNWNDFEPDSVFDDKAGFILNNIQEFGPTLEINLDTVSFTRFTQIHAQIDILNQSGCSGIITCELYKNNERISWQGRNVTEYVSLSDSTKWTTAHLNVNLLNEIKGYNSLQGYRVKVSFWNKDKTIQTCRHFKVELRSTNSREYGIIEPIP